MKVEPVRVRAYQVRITVGDDDLAGQRSTQPGDPNLDRLPGGRRRRLAPQLVDQPIDRDGLARAEQEEREQSPLLRTLNANRPALVPDLERSEDPEIHVAAIVTGP